MSIASLYEGVDIAKVMMGERAFHIPINFITQHASENGVAGVFQTTHGLQLMGGDANKFIHVLTMGDMIFRPRLMIGSDDFKGVGMAGLYKDGFISHEQWLKGTVILPPLDGDVELFRAGVR